jgi:hypothetical protein
MSGKLRPEKSNDWNYFFQPLEKVEPELRAIARRSGFVEELPDLRYYPETSGPKPAKFRPYYFLQAVELFVFSLSVFGLSAFFFKAYQTDCGPLRHSGSRHGYKSSSSKHQHGPATPAPFGCRPLLPAYGSRMNGVTCGT